MIPFDKTGNLYTQVTLYVSNLIGILKKLERHADDSPLLGPLRELQTDLMLALEKFQNRYPGRKP